MVLLPDVAQLMAGQCLSFLRILQFFGGSLSETYASKDL